MKQINPSFSKPNQAWILHREDIDTVQDGLCSGYFLLDAYSSFCLGHCMSIELPTKIEMINIFNAANKRAGEWPNQILISKKDPFVEELISIRNEFKVEITVLPDQDLRPLLKPFKDSFNQSIRYKEDEYPTPLSDVEEEELQAFIPDTYGTCSCASGKKFKFCCQKSFKDITFAMCAAEEGNLTEALHFMKEAEQKVGRTAEIVCRYAICWSFFDEQKYREYLNETININPLHPRLNYLLGIDAVADKNYTAAIEYYLKAINHYPKEDKFHLNEAYNNIGTAYFKIKKYQEAKEAWEKAFLYLPTDEMVISNLIGSIYRNPEVPKAIREISPYMKKQLSKRVMILDEMS